MNLMRCSPPPCAAATCTYECIVRYAHPRENSVTAHDIKDVILLKFSDESDCLCCSVKPMLFAIHIFSTLVTRS